MAAALFPDDQQVGQKCVPDDKLLHLNAAPCGRTYIPSFAAGWADTELPGLGGFFTAGDPAADRGSFVLDQPCSSGSHPRRATPIRERCARLFSDDANSGDSACRAPVWSGASVLSARNHAVDQVKKAVARIDELYEEAATSKAKYAAALEDAARAAAEALTQARAECRALRAQASLSLEPV